MANKKPTIFSGVQPSGDLHLGNYLGAISKWVELQDEYSCIFCVVDYHAITVKQNPDVLRRKIIEAAKHYIASGIDPTKSVIFQQSDIKEHTELAWILNAVSARISDLNKMTQFKDKTGVDKKVENYIKFLTTKLNSAGNIELVINNEIDYNFWAKTLLGVNEETGLLENVGVGLYDYPVLMAADILLYNTDAVPVGDDQSQHVELTRDLAKRFNHDYSEVFKIPELIIRKEGARIMGLDDPTKKMSKSATSELNYIALTDDPAKAAKKIMKAATDSEALVKFDKEKKPGISNLLTIYSLLAKVSIKDLEKKYQGKGYGDFKKDLAEVVKTFLINFQTKYNKISDKEVVNILKLGAEKIRPIAEKTVEKVKKSIGVN